MSSAQRKQMRHSDRFVHLELASLLDLVMQGWMWMSALILITVNLGSVSTQMGLSAVNVHMVTSSKEQNVWILMNVLLETHVEMELAGM